MFSETLAQSQRDAILTTTTALTVFALWLTSYINHDSIHVDRRNDICAPQRIYHPLQTAARSGGYPFYEIAVFCCKKSSGLPSPELVFATFTY
jgi:hypothetical protein